MRLDRPDRILAMLQEMVRDDEIDRLLPERLKALAVIDHVHAREVNSQARDT